LHKLRLALIMPVIQFVVAATLLQWGYRTPVPPGSEIYIPTVRLVCRGLNAPALLFRILDPFTWGVEWHDVPRSILGFDTGDIPFLVGVIVVWYLVGRTLDKRRLISGTAVRSRIAVALVACFLLLLGGFLFSAGLHDFGPGRPNNPGPPFGAILTLVWSITLIFLSGRELLTLIPRGRTAIPVSPTNTTTKPR
jgi:hypothetical protein